MRAIILLLSGTALLALSAPAEAGKKKKKDKTPRIEAPAPSVPAPSVGDGPWDAALRAGTKADTAFDLEGLAYVVTTFTIEADVSLLETVSREERDRLLRHVAADPRWRLVEHDGALVAFRRVEDHHGWSVPAGGYHEHADHVWRSALRFTPYDDEAPWASSALASRATASDPKVKVKAFRVTHPDPWEGVALVWQAPELAYEVYEARASTTLERVSAELATIPSYVDIATLESGEARGYVSQGMPEGHPSPTGEGLVVSLEDGVLDVRAWVRAPGRGFTWVRLFDGDGQPFAADAVARGTREMVGWSSEDVAFALQGSLPVTGSLPSDLYGELWFAAEGQAPERLGVWPATVVSN